MHCVILAAGRGTRMRELTSSLPKPLLESKGKTLLEHRLDILPAAITEIVLVIGYEGEQVIEKIGHRYNGRLVTYVWQKNLNGTGGALALAGQKVNMSPMFLVLLGDDLYGSAQLERLVTLGEKNEWAMTGVPIFNDGVTSHLHDRGDGYLEKFAPCEGRKNILMDGGIHMIGKEFFSYDLEPVPGKVDDIGNPSEFGIPQTLSMIARDIDIAIIESTDWTRITAPEDLS